MQTSRAHKFKKRPKPLLSVLIITRNRPKKLFQTLRTMSQSSITNFEVIIVDQSDRLIPESYLDLFAQKFTRLCYIHSEELGKSRGLNTATKLACSPILVFTDDDCVPDKHWLSSIYNTFQKHADVAGVFGKTKPYQPEKHIGLFCPSVFENKNQKPHSISKPINPSEWVGIGNNMAFRKSTLDEIGQFKSWLGPGSIGSNGEDAEMTLRALLAEKKLFYEPKAVTYHDRWVTLHQLNVQDLSYICGEYAGYVYIALSGNVIALELLKNELHRTFFIELRTIFSQFIHLKRYAFSLSFWWLAKMSARIRGILVGIVFSM